MAVIYIGLLYWLLSLAAACFFCLHAARRMFVCKMYFIYVGHLLDPRLLLSTVQQLARATFHLPPSPVQGGGP